MGTWHDMQDELDRLEREGLLRAERVVESVDGPWVQVAGRQVLCLCGNDYLGLAGDPALKTAACEAITKWGVGAGASRLVSGTTALHKKLEDAIAAFKQTESAVVTATGWAANHVCLSALVGDGDLVLCDKLNHASIIDAARASGALLRTYPHRQTARLCDLLEKLRPSRRRCVIATDSLFSMDGDLAPLAELVEVKKRYDALLVVDEAHATGVLGDNGRGAAELLGVEHEIDAVVGTLSKALGGLGGFVAGPRVLTDTIRNAGSPYIYSTALPPALCASAMAALEIVRKEPQRRQKVLRLAAKLRELLGASGVSGKRGQATFLGAGNDQSQEQACRTAGNKSANHVKSSPSPFSLSPFSTGDSVSQIIPVVIGDAGRAAELSARLLEAGFLVPAIRPPTVPRGTSRLRVSLSAALSEADVDAFADALRRLLPTATGTAPEAEDDPR